MNKRIRSIFQYLLFLGVGIFFAWLSLKDLDKENSDQIKMAIKNARYWLIIPVFGILFFSHYIRGLRWRLLIEPLGYYPTKLNSFFAVMIGYLVNQGVPRLGEVVKCTFLARYEKIPADKLIGTIILERIIDAITLLLIFAITLIIQPQIYSRIIEALFNSTSDKAESNSISSFLLTLILIAAVFLIIGLWMIIKKKTFADLHIRLKKIWLSIIQGIRSIEHLKKRKEFILLTLVLWSLYLSGGYIGFIALRETSSFGIKEAFTVLSAGSIGMIATPGGIGAYAFLLQKTMQIYGLQEGVALAFGWILWLVQTTVILIGGLISFVLIPYFNKSKISEPTRVDS